MGREDASFLPLVDVGIHLFLDKLADSTADFIVLISELHLATPLWIKSEVLAFFSFRV
jgi:hypothetical protein